MTIVSTSSESVAFGKIPQAIALAGVAGAVINTLIYFIGNAVGEMRVQLLLVPTMSIVLVAAGGLVYALLGKFTKRPIIIFLIVRIIVLILNAFGPLFAMNAPPLPGAPPFNIATVIATEIMHLVSGGLVIYAFTRIART